MNGNICKTGYWLILLTVHKKIILLD